MRREKGFFTDEKTLNRIVFVLWLAAVIFTAASFAYERVANCDYVSINGDFQSFNVFRRMLAGQTPYYDFANYIGMAPVIVNLPLLALKGNFAASLFVTNFTSTVIFCRGVLILVWLVCDNFVFACVFSALLPKIISSKILYRILGTKYGYIFTERFTGLFTPSNSMRGLRSFLPFLMVILCIGFRGIYRQIKKKDFVFTENIITHRAMATAGVICGVFVVWSNDFGLGCIRAFIVLVGIYFLTLKDKDYKKFLSGILIYILCRTLGLFISAALVTAGHPSAWFKAVRDTAGYQFFYFNGTEGKPVVEYILSQKTLLLYTAGYILLLGYYIYRFVKDKAGDKDLAVMFILLSVAGGTYAYVCSGSGYNFREALEVYFVITVVCLAAKAAFAFVKKYKNLLDLSMCLLLTVSGLYFGLVAYRSVKIQPEGRYIPRLGGTSSFTRALVDIDRVTGGEPVFSVYSTGYEAVHGYFNPTGYDYIIHCLGDEARDNYVAAFNESRPAFVQTPSMEIGAWAANRNWYFYRQFLPCYHKVYKTEYSIIWEKGEEIVPRADVTFTVERLDDGNIQIKAVSDCEEDFIAEFLVDYSTRFTNPLRATMSLGRKCVIAWRNVCFDSGLPGISLPGRSEEYIPVPMKDGSGRVTLSASYGEGIYLTVNNIEYVKNYPAFYLEYREE